MGKLQTERDRLQVKVDKKAMRDILKAMDRLNKPFGCTLEEIEDELTQQKEVKSTNKFVGSGLT